MATPCSTRGIDKVGNETRLADELREWRASLRGGGVGDAEEGRGHLAAGDDAAVGDLAAAGDGDAPFLAVLLRQGGAGVRAGRHIPAGQAQEGRRLGAGALLHTAVYRQLQVRDTEWSQHISSYPLISASRTNNSRAGIHW